MRQPTVVLLAAGENSRFFPLNTATHKAAVQLLGKPLVLRTLESLAEHGFEEVILVVSKKDADGNGLSGFLADYDTKLQIRYVIQHEAKGMGDALLCAEPYLHGPFAVIFPYLVSAGTEIRLLMQHAGNGGAIAVTYTKTPWLYGIIEVSGHTITGITEKPAPGTEKSNLKVRGLYYLEHEYLAFLRQTAQEEYSFESALSRYLQAFSVHAVEQTDALPSLKYPWHLFDFQEYLFASLPQYVSPYAHLEKTAVLDTSHGPIYIENGARVGHCSRIVGPCYIGKDVRIGDFSLIRASSFEEGSSVGVHSDVTRSIIMAHTSMHSGFLGDSIIGPKAKIGAGFISSNKRLDRSFVTVTVKGTKVDTGRTGLGTVIGQEAKVGINVATMPGKFIGTQAIVYPGAVLYDHVPHRATVRVEPNTTIQEAQ